MLYINGKQIKSSIQWFYLRLVLLQLRTLKHRRQKPRPWWTPASADVLWFSREPRYICASGGSQYIRELPWTWLLAPVHWNKNINFIISDNFWQWLFIVLVRYEFRWQLLFLNILASRFQIWHVIISSLLARWRVLLVFLAGPLINYADLCNIKDCVHCLLCLNTFTYFVWIWIQLYKGSDINSNMPKHPPPLFQENWTQVIKLKFWSERGASHDTNDIKKKKIVIKQSGKTD